MSTHTPGPPTYETATRSQKRRLTRDANARLIAAAPDLLAALRALITEWDRPREIPADPDWCDAIVGQARAAIAKAEGTS